MSEPEPPAARTRRAKYLGTQRDRRLDDLPGRAAPQRRAAARPRGSPARRPSWSRATPTVTGCSPAALRRRALRGAPLRLHARRGARAARRRHRRRRCSCSGRFRPTRSTTRWPPTSSSRSGTRGSSRDVLCTAARKRQTRARRSTSRSTPTSIVWASSRTSWSTRSRSSLRLPELEIAGIFSHLASAEELDSPYTMHQLGAFERALGAVAAAARPALARVRCATSRRRRPRCSGRRRGSTWRASASRSTD